MPVKGLQGSRNAYVFQIFDDTLVAIHTTALPQRRQNVG